MIWILFAFLVILAMMQKEGFTQAPNNAKYPFGTGNGGGSSSDMLWPGYGYYASRSCITGEN